MCWKSAFVKVLIFRQSWDAPCLLPFLPHFPYFYHICSPFLAHPPPVFIPNFQPSFTFFLPSLRPPPHVYSISSHFNPLPLHLPYFQHISSNFYPNFQFLHHFLPFLFNFPNFYPIANYYYQIFPILSIHVPFLPHNPMFTHFT